MSKESPKDLSLEEAEDVIEVLEEAIREARIHANSRAKHILTDALKETDLY
jgi:cell division GTPase FtsZ